jgi:hypothetical protein
MPQTQDFAVGPGPDGKPLLHVAHCPAVRAQAEAGEPVMTLIGCERHPRELDVAKHDCLRETLS